MSSKSNFLSNFFGPVDKPKRKTQILKEKSKEKSKKSSSSEKMKRPSGSIPYKEYYFIDIKRSKNPEKKLDAIFVNSKTGKEKRVAFGSKKVKDYTQHHDKKLRENYELKFKSKGNIKDLMSSATLSKIVLWSKPTVEAGIREYKRTLKSK